MLKIILMIVVGYFAYRLILRPLFVGPPAGSKKSAASPRSDEYIDYEEVDK